MNNAENDFCIRSLTACEVDIGAKLGQGGGFAAGGL